MRRPTHRGAASSAAAKRASATHTHSAAANARSMACVQADSHDEESPKSAAPHPPRLGDTEEARRTAQSLGMSDVWRPWWMLSGSPPRALLPSLRRFKGFAPALPPPPKLNPVRTGVDEEIPTRAGVEGAGERLGSAIGLSNSEGHSALATLRTANEAPLPSARRGPCPASGKKASARTIEGGECIRALKRQGARTISAKNDLCEC